MDNNAMEKDPWADMGNMTNSRPSEVSAEGLAREAEWNAAMADAPEFNANQSNDTTAPIDQQAEQMDTEAPRRDENIADASAIINYGMNAAAREIGVEATIQAIKNFVPNGVEDPIKQLLVNLGIDTHTEIKNLHEESRAAKAEEDAFRNESVNAPSTIKKSTEGALYAIKEVRELAAEVETSPAYANLRAEALKSGKGLYEYAVARYGVRDLTALFNTLSEQKEKYWKSQMQNTDTATMGAQSEESSDIHLGEHLEASQENEQ